MKSSAKKIELASVDDLFTTEQERQQAGEERVVRIPLSQLHYFKGYSAMQTEVPFTGQPYRVKDNDPKMLETLDTATGLGCAPTTSSSIPGFFCWKTETGSTWVWRR